MSQTLERYMSEIQDFSTDKEISHDMVELMDLPEPILLHIFSYFNHDFLRHVVSCVSMECKRLAHSQVLWSSAHLSNHESNAFMEDFVGNILATPYLHSLDLFLTKEDAKTKILAALVSTQCRIHKLLIEVDDYSPEIVLFLQQHPELRELELRDEATDNDYSANVAAIVGRLAPHLISLNLSYSRLFHLSKAGLFASLSVPHEEGHRLNPFESSIYFPELQYNQEGALDLRSDEDKTKQGEPHGLLHLKAEAANNLSPFLHAHKHSLKSVTVSTLCEEDTMWKALGECTKLEDLSVHCDTDGSGFCGMLQRLGQSALRRLELVVRWSLGSERLATVLRAVSRHAPRLEMLVLDGDRSHAIDGLVLIPWDLFPGFEPLRPLLVGPSATLRKVSITCIGPLGRAQLLELASMASAANGDVVPLRLLHTRSVCGRFLRWDDCQRRAEDALKAALPSLEYLVTCTCTSTPTWIQFCL